MRHQPLPLHLILGPLGAGKTSVLKQLLSQKPEKEHWLLIVNEFGALGIDDAILSSTAAPQTVGIASIPGGCICCASFSELNAKLDQLFEHPAELPDRIWIEPTGLAEPDALVDFFTLAEWQSRVSLQGVVAVFSCNEVTPDTFAAMHVYKNLFTIADVIVWNHQDQCSPAKRAELLLFTENSFPKKTFFLATQHGQLALADITFSHFHTKHSRIHNAEAPTFHLSLKTLHSDPKTEFQHSAPFNHRHQRKEPVSLLPQNTLLLDQGSNRIYKQHESFLTVGWLFPNTTVFHWPTFQTLFDAFTASDYAAGILRAKAILRVGNPWMLFQFTHGHTSRELIAYRKDSRLELIIDTRHLENATSWIAKFETDLSIAITQNEKQS